MIKHDDHSISVYILHYKQLHSTIFYFIFFLFYVDFLNLMLVNNIFISSMYLWDSYLLCIEAKLMPGLNFGYSMTCSVEYLRETKLHPEIKVISDWEGLNLIESWHFIFRVFNPFSERANWIERHDREFQSRYCRHFEIGW